MPEELIIDTSLSLENKENYFDLNKSNDSIVNDITDDEDGDITQSNLFSSILTQSDKDIENGLGDEDSKDTLNGLNESDDEDMDFSQSNLFTNSTQNKDNFNSQLDNDKKIPSKQRLSENDIDDLLLNDDDDDMNFTNSSLFSGTRNSEDAGDTQNNITHADPTPTNSEPNDTSILSTISYSYSIPAYTTTLSNGKVIQLKKKVKQPTPESTSDLPPGDRNHYGVPIHDLLLKVQLERTEPKQQVKEQPIKPSKALLSEKYRPKRWIDLMGPEKIHRHLLKWLVAWSHVVFHTELPHIDENDILRRDKFGRPHKKILLIHGPPGIGKTTIAHILAKQAGYDVLEINASDERSGQIVREKITTAVESHRIDKSRKPVCVIADEIEGAAESGFIRVLMDILASDQRALEKSTTTTTSKNSRKKKNKSKLLLRPIIAVCNDVYASSLRNLRPYAEVVHYPKSTTASIVTRLRDICSNERLKLDTTKLTEIVNTADGDLRSSLNMLQFGNFDNSDNLFHKDINQSWSKVTNRIFKRKDNLNKQQEAQDILKQIHANGEYDKIINGCFSLYPNVHYHDDMVTKPAAIGDWLYFYEQISSGIYKSQHHQLGQYLAQPSQAFYHNFSSTSNSKDHLIQTDFEFREAQMANKQLARDILENINPRVRLAFTRDEICSELAPYGLKIISPTTQASISSGIKVKGADKARIDNSAVAMVDLSLRFFQDKLENGGSAYRIDPPIQKLAIFDPAEQDRQAVGKFLVREHILTEVIRLRHEIHKGRVKRNYDDDDEKIDESNKRQKVEPEHKPAKRLASTIDFFGRTIVKEVSEPGEKAFKPVSEPKDRVWVQFVEGFSNAVRKDITWADLWQFD